MIKETQIMENTLLKEDLNLIEEFIASEIDWILNGIDTLITHRGFYLVILILLASVFIILLFIPKKYSDSIIYKGLHPLNKNISQYFASANTFILIR